jgi:hypothetical protein
MADPASISLLDANGNIVNFVRNTDRATEATLEAVLEALLDVAPASSAAAVTPSDVTVLVGVRALQIGTGGTVIATVGGVDATFTCADGDILPIKATKVKAASTASNIVALG